MRDRALYDRFASALQARNEPAPIFPSNGASPVAKAGLAVYRNNVRSSLSKALAEIFPVVSKLVGEDFFKFATREYFHAHPPSSPLLVHYGEKFPDFLATFEPARTVPYLSDMARFEMNWLEAYRAADAEPLDQEQVINAAGDDPSQLRLTLHPSLHLMKSNYPVISIWRSHQDEPSDMKIDNAAERILIVRPRNIVNAHTLRVGEFAAIEELASGATVGAAFKKTLEANPKFNLQEAFQTILTAEIITGAVKEIS